MEKQALNQDKPRIVVNGTGIAQDEINREAQYHPASDLQQAKKLASQALVIRELLLQEAIRKGICSKEPDVKQEEDIIKALLDAEITVPEPDEKTCRRYFETHKKRFQTSPLYEVSHILLPAPPNKKAQRKAAKGLAEKLIAELQENPAMFAQLAKTHSACSSKDQGGHMGQVAKGQTTPGFETALFQLKEGEMSREPVETRYGFHIIKAHKRAEGRDLDFEAVKDWIADYLRQASWQRAVSQYIQILAGQAEIKGFTLEGTDSPLVQ